MWPQLFGALLARYALRAAQRHNLASKIPAFDMSKFRGLDGFAPGTMSKGEALKILNIPPHQALDADKVREVHRKLLLANHPDRGGSTFISTKVNEAKETLIGKKK
jgi:DnaJ homolog subfamily C member 19